MNESQAKTALLDAIAGRYSLLIFVSSVLVYFNARRIVRNQLVFYVLGMVLGVFASLIGIAYMLQRLIPRQTLSLPIYLGGWPLSLYVYYQAYKNIGNVMRNYPVYLTSYIGICMLVSFAICYRVGPPSDQRTINLMQWFLQLCSLAGIYFSCPNKPVAVTIITILATYRFWWIAFVSTHSAISIAKKRLKEILFGPEPRKLLTEEEYLDEADIYTKMELDHLRQFCQNSPSQKSWKTISRLSDPRRMATFVSGDVDHISPKESREYCSTRWDEEDSEDSNGYMTDDKDDE